MTEGAKNVSVFMHRVGRRQQEGDQVWLRYLIRAMWCCNYARPHAVQNLCDCNTERKAIFKMNFVNCMLVPSGCDIHGIRQHARC